MRHLGARSGCRTLTFDRQSTKNTCSEDLFIIQNHSNYVYCNRTKIKEDRKKSVFIGRATMACSTARYKTNVCYYLEKSKPCKHGTRCVYTKRGNTNLFIYYKKLIISCKASSRPRCVSTCSRPCAAPARPACHEQEVHCLPQLLGRFQLARLPQPLRHHAILTRVNVAACYP